MNCNAMQYNLTDQITFLFPDLDSGLPHDKVKEFAHVSSDRIFEHEDHGPVESVKASVGFIQTEVTKIAQAIQDGEYDISTVSSTEEKV
jgi:dynactin 1